MIPELEGKPVTVNLEGGGHDKGILRSCKRGVLIDDSFFPWRQIREIRLVRETDVKKLLGEVEKEIKEIKDGISIIEKPETTDDIITEAIPDSYDFRWEDDDTIEIDDDDGDTALIIHMGKQIIVNYDKDLDLAIDLAKKLMIKTVAKDYE